MNEKIKMIEGGVTAAKGFMAASTAAGIKYKNRQDMAMIYSKEPCKSAGTFTTNLVKAAPVKWDKNQVTNGVPARAVVINAGIANACTGGEGKEINEYMASQIAEALGVSTKEVLTASTGVIGMQIKKEPIQKGAKLLKESDMNISEIAQHIGFSSRSYFARSFKAVYGMSPTEYQETKSQD